MAYCQLCSWTGVAVKMKAWEKTRKGGTVSFKGCDDVD
jgi:hypothetical protein